MANEPSLWEGFFETSVHYTSPLLTEAMVAAAEASLGHTLPESYLRLLRVKNGGYRKIFISDELDRLYGEYLWQLCDAGADVLSGRIVFAKHHFNDLGFALALNDPAPDRSRSAVQYVVTFRIEIQYHD